MRRPLVEPGMSDVATYTVRAEFEGDTHSFPCRADQTVLNAAEAAGITLPSSCCSGVCTCLLYTSPSPRD